MLFLDTETTGVSPTADEILSIAIIDEAGKILLDTYLKPKRNTSWPAAERVNGISPAFIFGAKFPTADDIAAQVKSILSDQDVCAYNAAFDMPMIYGNFRTVFGPIRQHCAMNRWAIWKDVPSTKHYHTTGFVTWPLATRDGKPGAADETGHVWTGKAHGALADTYAARHVWQWLDVVESGEEPDTDLAELFPAGIAHIGACATCRRVKHPSEYADDHQNRRPTI